MTWWVYLIRCGDKSLYTGISTDPERRLRQHLGELKGGARSLRGRKPLELVYREMAGDRSDASRRERVIKSMSHRAKEALVASRNPTAIEGAPVSIGS